MWKLITLREVNLDESKNEENKYILKYKRWGYVVKHTIHFNNPSSLRRRIHELDTSGCNYTYSIYKEVIE